MANFPTLGNKEDSSKFGFQMEDVGVRSPMEGGYVLTRPRHTRTPRRTWTTGFTDISNDEKLILEAFINEHGTFKAFTYIVPVGSENVNARFKEMPKFEFAGWPQNPRWNLNDIMIEEV